MAGANTKSVVLFVDLDPGRRAAARAALEPDYEVLLAVNLQEAAEALRRPIDVIIAAHPLGSDSGLALLRECRARQAQAVRVVATEARESAVLVEAVNEARVSYVLRTPWESGVLRELVDGLSGLVGARRRRDEPLTLPSDSSSKETFTGLLTLPSFFRRLQGALGELGPGEEATVFCAEIDEVGDGPAEEPARNPRLRLLAACTMDASSAQPKSHVARGGTRILAYLPGCSGPKAQEIGEQIVASFARATCMTLPATGSLGLASFPRHATSAMNLLELSEEALHRAQRTGGGRVAECLPRLLMLGPLGIFQKAVSSFTRRQDVVLKVVESIEQLPLLMERERPAAILANLLGPVTALDQVQLLVRKPMHAETRVILVTPKPPKPEYAAKAARVPGAQLVCGPDRFVPRLVEAAIEALGIKQRQTVRLKGRVQIAFAVGGNGARGKVTPAVLENFAEQGALVNVAQRVEKGDAVALVFGAAPAAIEIAATVVRVTRLGIGKFDCAVKFAALSDAQLEGVGRFVAAATPERGVDGVELTRAFRATDRYAPPQLGRIKVRVRPVGKATTTYLEVANLGLGGCLGVAAPTFEPKLKAGGWFEAMVYDQRGSVHCLVEVTHQEQRKDGRWQLGMRFASLERDAKAQLQRIISECHVEVRR